MAVSRPLTFALGALLAATVLGGCGDADEQRAASELEAAGKTAEGNVGYRSEGIFCNSFLLDRGMKLSRSSKRFAQVVSITS